MTYSGAYRFLIIFAVFLTPVWVYYIVNKTENRNTVEEIIQKKKNARLIYAGGSSLSFAVRDSNNLADLNEPYLFTLKKIQLLKPQKVVLSVGLNYFFKHYDKVYEDGLLTKASYQLLSSKLSAEEENSIKHLTRFETRSFYVLQNIFPFMGTKMSTEDKNRLFGGDYHAGNISKINSFILGQRIKVMFPKGKIEWSDHQWEYFEKILAFCKENKIEVILLSAPVNAKLSAAYPEKAFHKYQQKFDAYVQKYNVDLLDYTNLTLPDSCFYDGDHLNDIGAKYFMSLRLK